MSITKKEIDQYVESKRYAWSEATSASVRARLNSVAEWINGDAVQLWDKLSNLAPYSKSTTWIAVMGFWDVHSKLANPYRVWRKQNARQFKHVYERKPARYSYSEVKQRLSLIKNNHIRDRAFKMLSAGLRYCESGQGDGDTVRGKGSKVRRIYAVSVSVPADTIGYQKFRRALKAVGLKSHDLRKAFATALYEKGANEFEMCEIMGWESIETAKSYIKVNTNKMEELVRKVQNG